MIANLNDVLNPAAAGKYAVGLYNIVSMEQARGVLAAAEETNSPVIVGTAEILFRFLPLKELSYFLVPMAEAASVPVVLHMDHALSLDTCKQAVDLGFSSVMYDCSGLDYEENVANLAEAAEYVHKYNVTIEGELGHVGNNEGFFAGATHDPDPSLFFTDPQNAKEYVEATKVDALAIAIGNAHGAYKFPPKLDFDRITDIHNTIDTNLVLHGGSGLSDEDFRKAIELGISKVNIFTDIDTAMAQAQYACYKGAKTGTIDWINAGIEAVKQETIRKFELFSCIGKAK